MSRRPDGVNQDGRSPAKMIVAPKGVANSDGSNCLEYPALNDLDANVDYTAPENPATGAWSLPLSPNR
jgi:hypothetical protein